MKEQTHAILCQMAKVVGFPMGNLQSDFAIYDSFTLRKAEENGNFPILWVVDEYSTHMEVLGAFEQNFNKDEAYRYAWMQGNTSIAYYLQKCNGRKYYFIGTNEMREVSLEQAKEIVQAFTMPVIERWEQNNELPKKFKVQVHISGISLDRLKELLYEAEANNDPSLRNCLHRFRRYSQVVKNHRIDIWWNERDKTFYWTERFDNRTGLNGGIVFHGYPDTGYQENGSIQLEPKYGWSSHT